MLNGKHVTLKSPQGTALILSSTEDSVKSLMTVFTSRQKDCLGVLDVESAASVALGDLAINSLVIVGYDASIVAAITSVGYHMTPEQLVDRVNSQDRRRREAGIGVTRHYVPKVRMY